MEILLPVPQVLQNPELPNGCEITSLCEVLRYWGFAADKCDLADHYLPRSARWYGADPDRVYMGDPHKDDGSPETGYYCFAGPVVAAANAYLAAHGGGYTAHDLTGVPLQDMPIRPDVLLCCINRKGKRIIPRGKDELHEGDTVIVVSTRKGMNDLQDIFRPESSAEESHP